MKKDRWDYQNRYEGDNQYEYSEYIFINPNDQAAWSLRSADEDEEEADWQDAEYDED